MESEVYKGHGIIIRRIDFRTAGSRFEFERYDSLDMMTLTEFRKMVLTLVKHLLETEG